MQKNNYQIILNFLDGKLSAEEKYTFAQWRKATPENEKQFQEVKFLWQKAAAAKKQKTSLKIDAKAALAKVHQQLPPTAKVIPLRKRLLKYVAAASVLILMGLMTWVNLFQAEEMVLVATLDNETKEIKLPDNSIVWLNENSTFSYPKTFANSARKVNMEGDVIFEVTHSPQQPFVVSTQDLAVTVLGTKFNINTANRANQIATVHVINGKVQVQKKDNPAEKVLLTKGMTAQLAQNQLATTNAFSNNQLFWYHQTLAFEQTHLKTVLQTLNQTYNTTIKLTNQSLLTCTFSGTFKAQTLPEILETLQLIYGFEIKNIDSTTPQLNNGKCQ